MSKKLYFISDLHIGGAGIFNKCNFAEELINFLDLLDIESQNYKIELYIVGDTFGMWEMISIKNGTNKLIKIIGANEHIFQKLKEVGSKIRIILLPGNHDQELFAYPQIKKILLSFNIHLHNNIYKIKALGSYKIWIEHGNQYDPINKIIDYYQPHAYPFGYYFLKKFVSNALQATNLGKQKWMQDFPSVTPNEDIPNWFFSNYFFWEMNPIIRYAISPFLFFFTLSFLSLIVSLGAYFGIINQNYFLNLGTYFGLVGNVLDMIIFINSIIIIALLIIFVPVIYLIKDYNKIFGVYGISSNYLQVENKDFYIDNFKKINKKKSDVRVFIYGHSHRAFMKLIDNLLIINTGTWSKKFLKIKTRLRFILVYYPYYQINYFVCSLEDQKLKVEYKQISKNIVPNLTWLQRILIFGKNKIKKINIPDKIIFS